MSRSKRTTAYVNSALDVDHVGFSAVDMQLTEGRQQAVLEIARITGVPHGLLAASPQGATLTYRNIEGEVVLEHLDHMHMMVSLEVNLAEVVFIQEVIADDQTLVVVGERDHVRSGVEPQIDDAGLNRMLRIGDVEHSDLARLERREDQAIAGSRHREKLRHSSANRHLDVGNDGLAVEDDLRRSIRRVDQVDQPVEHPGCKGASERISGDQLDVHRPDGARNVDRADDCSLLKIPHPDDAAKQRIAGDHVQRTGGHHEI